jgi:IS5 family transposase
LFYQQVLAQQPKDKNKIYSLHEPDVYVIAKGKDHKQYEYGNKVSIVSPKQKNSGYHQPFSQIPSTGSH